MPHQETNRETHNYTHDFRGIRSRGIFLGSSNSPPETPKSKKEESHPFLSFSDVVFLYTTTTRGREKHQSLKLKEKKKKKKEEKLYRQELERVNVQCSLLERSLSETARDNEDGNKILRPRLLQPFYFFALLSGLFLHLSF
jgi:hypothetical protein